MTKEITKAVILQEIQDKFKLREYVPTKFLFDETVVPTYDIGEHLKHPEVVLKDITVSSGPTAYMIAMVPENQRWALHSYNVIFVTGSYTVAGVMLYQKGLVADYLYIDLSAAQSTSYINYLPTELALDPKDRLYVYVDGYTSTGTLNVRLHVTKEEIR